MLLGALLVMGVALGPTMLTERPVVFWGVVASIYIGNLFLLILNLLLIPCIARILELPCPILLALILVFCVIGFLMRLNGFPIAPLILTIILGESMEDNMRSTLQISGRSRSHNANCSSVSAG